MRFIRWLGSGGRSTLITAALVSVAAGSLAAQRDTASGAAVRGRVIDALSAVPLGDVNVVVTAGNDTLGHGQSDVGGAFVLGLRATPATAMMHFAREGYRGDSLSIDLSARVDVPLEPIRVAMTPTTKVVASGRARPPLTGAGNFDARAAHHGDGVFLTEAEIERRSPIQTSDLFRGMSGVSVDDSAGVLRVVSTRGVIPNFLSASVGGSTAPAGPPSKSTGSSGSPAARGAPTSASPATAAGATPQRCTLSVAVDGQMMDATFTVDELPPTMIHGIEVYLGASTVPIQYTGTMGNGAVCGLIMIWTRTGNDSG